MEPGTRGGRWVSCLLNLHPFLELGWSVGKLLVKPATFFIVSGSEGKLLVKPAYFCRVRVVSG